MKAVLNSSVLCDTTLTSGGRFHPSSANYYIEVFSNSYDRKYREEDKDKTDIQGAGVHAAREQASAARGEGSGGAADGADDESGYETEPEAARAAGSKHKDI